MTDATNKAETKDNKAPVFGVAAIAFLIWAIAMTVLYVGETGEAEVLSPATASSTTSMMTAKTSFNAPNVCNNKKLDLPNIDCMVDAVDDGSNVSVDAMVVNAGAQTGANVTKGYNGDLKTDVVPITKPYYQAGLCPVNVHWHLGTEHYSAGEYDCAANHEDDPDHHRERDLKEDKKTCGPSNIDHRRKLSGKARQGYQCNLYDAEDQKFTNPYEWKHCDASMEVGQTYEVHWPHSAAGSCGTPNQYQSPFYDGVFCNLDMPTLLTLKPQDIASAVGVQAQVFVIVNDESYYYPDLIKGMLVEPTLKMGGDLAIFTGSTTGTSRNNTVCSSYTPITWQVDRVCHPISASSFDKMCADMKSQRDDMSEDLYAHGSRELVADTLAANNHANLRA